MIREKIVAMERRISEMRRDIAQLSPYALLRQRREKEIEEMSATIGRLQHELALEEKQLDIFSREEV